MIFRNAKGDLLVKTLTAKSGVFGTMTGAVTLPTYTVAQATPALAAANPRMLIWVSDGAAGSPTLAVSDGTNFKVVALGATIAAS